VGQEQYQKAAVVALPVTVTVPGTGALGLKSLCSSSSKEQGSDTELFWPDHSSFSPACLQQVGAGIPRLYTGWEDFSV